MNLYLLRHGIAVEPGTHNLATDSERPLTPEGESKLRQVAIAMRTLKLSFDLILSSPYLRARQTAELVAATLRASRKLELTDTLTPHGRPEELVDSLLERDPVPEDVLLVGHEPYLSELISLLVTGNTGSAFVLKKAGLCKLSTESLAAGRCAALEWLLTPKQMQRMAES